MSWFVRFSRFGSAHMVRSQDLDMSCAMASIVMVNFKMKKGLMFAGMAAGASLQVSGVPGGSWLGSTLSSAARDYAIKSEAEVYKLYEKHKGGAHDFNTAGAQRTLYPKVLADLGLGQWEYVNVGKAGLAQAVIDTTSDGSACIVGCTWDGGGGHAMVIDDSFNFFGSRYLAVCDPWDGELRITSATIGQTVKYDGSSSPVSSGTIFGCSAHSYTPGSTGALDGGITRRKK